MVIHFKDYFPPRFHYILETQLIHRLRILRNFNTIYEVIGWKFSLLKMKYYLY